MYNVRAVILHTKEVALVIQHRKVTETLVVKGVDFMREKKEIVKDGYSQKTCVSTYTHGNTIIRVVEHFKEEGSTITDLLENAIRFEGKRMEDKERTEAK